MYLQPRGLTIAAEGIVDSYIHLGTHRVLVEVNCETDLLPEPKNSCLCPRHRHAGGRGKSYIKAGSVPEEILQKGNTGGAGIMKANPACH